MGVTSRMIPTEDASARKREIEEKLKQVRHGCRGRKRLKGAFYLTKTLATAASLHGQIVTEMSLPVDRMTEVSQCFFSV